MTPGALVAQVAVGTYNSLSTEQVEPGLTAVCQEMEARGFSPAQLAIVQAQAASRVHVFTDGYKSLQNTIVAFFYLAPGSGVAVGPVSRGREIQRGLELGVSWPRDSQSASALTAAILIVWSRGGSASVSSCYPHGRSQRRCSDYPASELA